MKKLFLLITTALLALVSCTEENLVNDSVVSGRIQASFEEGIASRLAVGEKNALTWSAYDTFVMFNDVEESSYWKMTGTPGMETGTFEGHELDGILKGAAFPSTAFPTVSGNILNMTLPTELSYEAGICNLPMWASFSALEENISFKHLGALLKVNLADIPEGYNRLVITADRPIAGFFTADLSASEPVLKVTEKGVNSVKVSFATITDNVDNDRMFYIPLPVGTYGSINVSISDGTKTLSMADWSNRTIVRKKVYVASLSYRVSDATTPTEITEELDDMMEVTSNATVDITGKVEASEGSIVLPTEASKIALNFEQVPVTSSTSPLKFEEASATDGSQLAVSLPVSTEETYMEFNTPTSTVNVNGGNYKQIIARTASNTLVFGENSIVEDLVILAGNVVLEGGKITGSITRDASNTDTVTYLYVENKKELEGVTIGEGIKVVDNIQADYVTFVAESEQTFRMSSEVATLEYSVNNGRWSELGTTTVTFGGEKGALRLRGKSAIGTALSSNASSQVIFGNQEVPVACTGNILTLVDYENYEDENLDTSRARFCNLFFNCKSLTSAPKLPAMHLASECYWQMFVYCSNLTEAPELPAKTLATDCYRLMFYECTSLKTAPELPATTLVPLSYYGMFHNCTNLKYAPKILPAETLTDQCYSMMFYGCNSLIEAPELPATTLASQCYSQMFYGCNSLIEAPELPATTLAIYCYERMFYRCTGLREAPELPATTMMNGSYSNMFYECTGLREAPELPATTLAHSCYIQMFYGCTGIKVAPELPAKTLAPSCYRNMFMGCSGLTAAPELPVMELADECYYGMFWDCSNLQVAPELPATIMARGCYTIMFGGCSSLKKAPKLPAMVLAESCYSSMFSDCIGLTSAPELPVTILADGCYSNMFARCTNLTSAPELPATVMKRSCYSMMFAGCTGLTTTPELPATVLADWCYQGMFMNCTNLTKVSVLPATTLVPKCYMMMFQECENLNYVTMLATDVSADMCLTQWLNRTASSGTFYKNSSVTDVSAYEIPNGWEVKDY